MNKEIIETIKNAKTSDELKELASRYGYSLTNEEAKNYFDLYHSQGKINEEELDNVTGGSKCIGGSYYSEDSHGYLIVTWGNKCNGYVKDDKGFGTNCGSCKFIDDSNKHIGSYCTMRTRYDDPYNDKIGTKRILGPNKKYWNEHGQDFGYHS